LVDVISLDTFLSQRKIERVDFVKLDVEGAELGVMKGASNLLSIRPRPLLLVEVCDIRTRPWGYEGRDIVRYMDEAGYRLYRLLEGGEPLPVSANLDMYDMNMLAVPVERGGEIAALLAGKKVERR
jgi:hypothetical protein